LITIAENPKVIIASWRKGTGINFSPVALTGLLNSNHLKNANNTNAILQISVNRDKNKITFIRMRYKKLLLKTITKIILICCINVYPYGKCAERCFL
jgi:hypothetical protein